MNKFVDLQKWSVFIIAAIIIICLLYHILLLLQTGKMLIVCFDFIAILGRSEHCHGQLGVFKYQVSTLKKVPRCLTLPKE